MSQVWQLNLTANLQQEDTHANSEAKAHHVGEWASLRNTSPEIAEAIFEVAGYDEKMAEKIWEEGSDEVLSKPLLRPIKIRFWGEQTIERKNV
ncbi:MAG: YccJ family protein [Escherichia coli]